MKFLPLIMTDWYDLKQCVLFGLTFWVHVLGAIRILEIYELGSFMDQIEILFFSGISWLEDSQCEANSVSCD